MESLPLNLKENLKNKYVAFIDVMGFGDLVNNNSIKNLEDYFLKIREVLNNIKKDKANIQSLLISDSIILIAPDDLQELKQLFNAIRRIQTALLLKKILLRGAVSFGSIYYNNDMNIIVGKGFIKAYLLEKEAVFPRVIIDPFIIKKIAEDRADFIKKINGENSSLETPIIFHKKESRLNDDGIFIDYASFIIEKNSIHPNIKKVYEIIQENLYKDQKFYTKFTWLKNYFLETLNEMWNELFDSKNPLDWSSHQVDLKDWSDKFERL